MMNELKQWKSQLQLLENKSQAEKFLRDHNIPADNPLYQRLKQALIKDNAIGYLGPFTELIFKQNADKWQEFYNEVMRNYERLKADPALRNALPKPIHQFTHLGDFNMAIEEAEQRLIIKRFADKAVRDKDVKAEMLQLKNPHDRDRLVMEIQDFNTQTDDERSEFLKTSSRHHTFNDWFNAFTNHNSNVKDGFSYATVKNKISGMADVELLYDDQEKGWLLIRVHTYEASRALGATAWCIVGQRTQWDNYVTSKGNIQYFYFDFNAPSYNMGIIGLTMQEDGEVYACHDRNDHAFEGLPYLKERGVMPKIKAINRRQFALKLQQGVKKMGVDDNEEDRFNNSDYIRRHRMNAVFMSSEYVMDKDGKYKKDEYNRFVKSYVPNKDSYNQFKRTASALFLGLVALSLKENQAHNLDMLFQTYEAFPVHFFRWSADDDEYELDHSDTFNAVVHGLNHFNELVRHYNRTHVADEYEEQYETISKMDYLKVINAVKTLSKEQLLHVVKEAYVRSVPMNAETKRAVLHTLNDAGSDPMQLTRQRKEKSGEAYTDSEFGVSAKQGANHTAKVMDKINRFRRGEDIQLTPMEIKYAIDNGYGDFIKEEYSKILDDPHFQLDYDDLQIIQKVGLFPKLEQLVVNKVENEGYGQEGLNSLELSVYQHAKAKASRQPAQV